MKFFTKIGKMGEERVEVGEIPYHDRAVRSKAIGFKKYVSLLKPGEEVVVFAAEFDIAEGTIAQHVASDAHVCLVSVVDSRC